MLKLLNAYEKKMKASEGEISIKRKIRSKFVNQMPIVHLALFLYILNSELTSIFFVFHPSIVY